jgi:hypothetical protein
VRGSSVFPAPPFQLTYQLANARFFESIMPGGNPDAPGTYSPDGHLDQNFNCSLGATQTWLVRASNGGQDFSPWTKVVVRSVQAPKK